MTSLSHGWIITSISIIEGSLRSLRSLKSSSTPWSPTVVKKGEDEDEDEGVQGGMFNRSNNMKLKSRRSKGMELYSMEFMNLVTLILVGGWQIYPPAGLSLIGADFFCNFQILSIRHNLWNFWHKKICRTEITGN